MTYLRTDFALTPPRPAPSMQPESSDGLASVGTILPKERAALNRAAFSVLRQANKTFLSGTILETIWPGVVAAALRPGRIPVKSRLEFADVAQLVEQLIRNQ